MNKQQFERMQLGKGFIAALDQSGGSTPKALKSYGIAPTEFSGEDEMYALVHEMRTRIIKSPAFTSDRILGAILFENTMDRQIDGEYTADYLWNQKRVVPFLKVDQGLEDVKDGVQLMKNIVGLDDLLKRAKLRHIFGTKMRSVIHTADKDAIQLVVDQQFKIGRIIASYGLVPIIEPEVDITIPDKKEAEALLRDALVEGLKSLKEHEYIMFKLSIPTVPDLYADIMKHPNVVRVVALSGGYPREEANALLSKNHGLIASFSRALAEGLTYQQTDAEFDAMLSTSIQTIYEASVD